MVTTLPPLLGANPERARSHNRQLVLGAVRSAGAVGRAEIARRSGLSTQAVSNIIADLLDAGLLEAQGHRSAGRGSPVQQYALCPAGGYALGFEVRPNAVFSALVDLCGKAVVTHRIPLPSVDRHCVVATVQGEVARIVEQRGLGQADLLGAGIVMPGPFGATGLGQTGSELPGWADADPAVCFAEALGLPVFVENDANAAAMAEHMTGRVKALSNFAYLYFGQGLGLGLVHNSALIPGAFGNAGEIGHLPINGKPLEQWISRLSVATHLAAHGVSAPGMEELSTLYAAQHPALMGWLDDAAKALSPAVSIIENLFDPQAIVLGGAMSDVILDHLIATTPLPARSISNRADRSHPRLLRGTSDRMTATLGAAALVLHQTFTPTIATANTR